MTVTRLGEDNIIYGYFVNTGFNISLMYCYYTMETAHILVKCDDKKDDKVLDEIKSIAEVREIEKTFGAYNAVVRIEAESVQKIKNIMAEKIRNRPGIISTLTLVNA